MKGTAAVSNAGCLQVMAWGKCLRHSGGWNGVRRHSSHCIEKHVFHVVGGLTKGLEGHNGKAAIMQGR